MERERGKGRKRGKERGRDANLLVLFSGGNPLPSLQKLLGKGMDGIRLPKAATDVVMNLVCRLDI